MARPVVEWPIPVYVAEFRTRLSAAFRVPGAVAGALVPSPLAAETRAGWGLVVLTLGSARCLKSVGAHPVLASEFHSAEVWIPARWQGACRPPLRGSYLLAVSASRPGLNRLTRVGLHLPALTLPQRLEVRGGHQVWQGPGWHIEHPRPGAGPEPAWPTDSAFATAESAEAGLLHPDAVFSRAGDGRALDAFPVHQYARSTVPVRVESWSASWVAASLGLTPHDLELDSLLAQRRCTHTWAFPPERIPLAAPRGRRVLADRPGGC